MKTEILSIDSFEILEDSTFSGRLSSTTLGYVEDPEFGTLRSVALLKPSIVGSSIDTLLDDDSMSMRLIFNNIEYGNSSAVSNFEVYEAGEIWRGTQLRYNDPISVDFSSKIGEFQMTDEDTVTVPLSDAWTARFAEFFNDTTDIDSTYVNEFPGIAIVPSEGNQNIKFLKNSFTNQNENQIEFITSLILEARDEDDEDEDLVLSFRDWGSSFTRTDEPEFDDSITLHNTERVLKLGIDFPDDLSNRNIVDARLVLVKKELSLTPTGFERPVTEVLRANVFDREPEDVMAQIFSTEPNFFITLENDSASVFKLDITQHVLNEVYGEKTDSELYLTIESVNGTLYSSRFYDLTATEESLKPRIVITYVE